MGERKNTHAVHPKKGHQVKSSSKVSIPAVDPLIARAIGTIELDEPDMIIPGDKIEPESTPANPEEEETASEEVSLDDEELNPFEDKWEV